MSKETFKSFVKTKPELIDYVINKNISWQKLYELYELYGENTSIWSNYLGLNKTNSFNEIINTIKNIDLEKLQSGIENIQSTISMIQNFGNNNQDNYSPRPKYTHLDD